MSDFPDIARELLSRDAAFQVQNEQQLSERVRQLLADPELGVRMGRTGRLFVHQHRGTTERIVQWIQRRLGTL